MAASPRTRRQVPEVIVHATTRSLPAVLAAAALTVALAGCGSGGDGSGATSGGAPTTAAAPAVTKDDALAAMVPASVSSDGKLVFGTDASYPPNEFTAPDGTTIIGLDVDLGTAVAQKLGLTPEFQNSQFSGIIPGIEGARYELGISSFTINDERIKTVDMVSYFSAGTSLAVASGNPEGITPDNLCGRAVGVQAGTVQVDDVAARSQACTAAGQPAIAVTELQQQTDVTLALTSKRIVAMLADSPVVSYAVTTTSGAVEVVGEPWDTAPYGIALGKSQGQFAQAVQGALQAMIADGSYAAILQKWNVSNGAIATSEVRS
ncbi:ABC transporter substrate-binding protein [Pseudonocardia xinjiangensis]|uniref:ABC transporter substrate-binding protein n=1 Tax=Pseudonocardia xinjiangensis TaxID=75289 RepID=A0ABX1RJ11_9PSEU|nr:ABC transporter substrate-binding protein [Pseudonocardia xinjiangensis]NMH79972.1 ABC transporter substrate-binding protein [Pseudonocardia xinjiangensis]